MSMGAPSRWWLLAAALVTWPWRLAATTTAPPAATVFDWMRAHGIVQLCTQVEVLDRDPATARLLASSGDAEADELILTAIRRSDRIQHGIEGQVGTRYTTSPQRVPWVFNLNSLDDPATATLGCGVTQRY